MDCKYSTDGESLIIDGSNLFPAYMIYVGSVQSSSIMILSQYSIPLVPHTISVSADNSYPLEVFLAIAVVIVEVRLENNLLAQ